MVPIEFHLLSDGVPWWGTTGNEYRDFFGGRGPNLIPILVFYRIMYSVQVTPLMFNINI